MIAEITEMRSSSGRMGLKTMFNTNRMRSLIVLSVLLFNVISAKVRRIYRKVDAKNSLEKHSYLILNEIQCKSVQFVLFCIKATFPKKKCRVSNFM